MRTCDYCCKKFASRSDLKKHRQLAHPGKPFDCACGARCNNADDLRRHQVARGHIVAPPPDKVPPSDAAFPGGVTLEKRSEATEPRHAALFEGSPCKSSEELGLGGAGRFFLDDAVGFGEDDRTEFKASFDAQHSDKYRRTITAFLNTRGGTLYF